MKDMKTLLIEDENISRQRISGVIEKAKGVELIGSLKTVTEEELREQIDKADPDVILIGINSLDSGEMALFKMLRSEYPALPVIVLPNHDREGAKIALMALKKGAVEYVNKTQSFSGIVHTEEHFNRRLVPVIKAVPRFNQRVVGAYQNVEEVLDNVSKFSMDSEDQSLIRKELLVVVGCLGGVPALYLLLSSLPHNLPVPVIVVQHMPKIYTTELAEDLERLTGLKVREATDNMPMEAGTVYIAPGDHHAHVNTYEGQNMITLNQTPRVQGFRPSIDELLQSTKNTFGNRLLVVYLSGGGNDGIEGAEVLDTVGGQIIIQNRTSSLLWDLPFKINVREISEGCYSLENLGYQILERLN